MDRTGDGRLYCTQPEYPETWVRFKDRGYPFKLRREIEPLTTDQQMLPVILPYVVEWNLTGLDGQPVTLPAGEREAALLDNVDEIVASWLVRAFFEHRGALIRPRPNSSPPSTST